MPRSGDVVRLTTGCPKSRISPASSLTRPAIARISVVLPAPFGPSSASSSPSRNASVAPSSAATSPNFFLTPLTVSTSLFAIWREDTQPFRAGPPPSGERRLDGGNWRRSAGGGGRGFLLHPL